MPALDERLVRKLYAEIIGGFSIVPYKDAHVYVKHFTTTDLLEFDYRYQEILEKITKKGICSEQEKIDILVRDGLWDKGNEKKIEDLKLTIRYLYSSKRKLYSPADLDRINKEIKENESSLYGLILERFSLIGECAESIARKKNDTDRVFNSFYVDSSLSKKLLSYNDIDNIEDEDSEILLNSFRVFSEQTGEDNVKRVALSSDFQNAFNLTESLYEFYGHPISKLTSYQIKLSSYGKYFRNILSGQTAPPQELMADPDKLEDWFYARGNIIKLLEDDGKEGSGGAISISGVTKKDMDYLKIEGINHGPDRAAILKKYGGSMTMQQMIDEGL